jgi:hypothetical protein
MMRQPEGGRSHRRFRRDSASVQCRPSSPFDPKQVDFRRAIPERRVPYSTCGSSEWLLAEVAYDQVVSSAPISGNDRWRTRRASRFVWDPKSGGLLPLWVAAVYAVVLLWIGSNAVGAGARDCSGGVAVYRAVYWLALPTLLVLLVIALRALHDRQALRALLYFLASGIVLAGLIAARDIVDAKFMDFNCGV